jgi:signal transduction histidine kinase
VTRFAKAESVRWWHSQRTVPLSWYLVALISIATVPLAMFAAYLVLQQSHAAQSQLERNLRAAASGLALAVERDLAASTEALHSFGGPDLAQPPDRAAIEREVTRLLARRADWIGVFVLDADGAVILARGDDRALAMANARVLPPLRLDPSSARDVFELIRARVGQDDLTAVTVPMRSSKATPWTLGAIFQPDKWQVLLDRQAPEVDGFIGIFDRERSWIAKVAKPARGAAVPAVESLQGGAESSPGRVRRVAESGVPPAYIAWHGIGATGWSTAVGFAAEPFDRQRRDAIVAAVVGGLLAFAVGLVSALVVSRGVTSPLARLAEGLWPQRTGGKRPTVTEIERLTRALETAETERDADRAALQAKADEFETLFRRTPVGLVVAADPECRDVAGNAALAQMLGLPASADFSFIPAPGEPPAPFKLYADRTELTLADLSLYAAARRGEESQGVEYTVVRADGQIVQLLAYAAPLRASDGSPRGAVGAFVDVTERTRKDLYLRETQARLEASEQRVELAQDVGRVGFFEYDFVRDVSVWTSGMTKLFGIDHDAFAGSWSAWSDLVEPVDMAKLRAAIDAAVAAKSPTVAFEYRARHRDGTGRVLASRAVLLYAGDGAVQRMVGAAVDITEQHLTAEERSTLLEREQEARRDAEAANRSKDEFLAMFSHELRNPLSAIAAAAEVLNRIGGQKPDEVRARDVIRRQVHHLTHMMEDLLDVTRVVNGKVTLSRGPLDLATAVQRAASALNVTGRLREHRIELDLAPTWIHADITRVEQIASNLLINAAKYTPQGGTISVKVAGEGENALLAVSDTGVGIDPAMLDRVFDLFVQVDGGSTRRHGGLGVGLTLVRRLTELHGGSVVALSEGFDRGSRFEVRLPRIAPPRRN